MEFYLKKKKQQHKQHSIKTYQQEQDQQCKPVATYSKQ